MNDFRQSEIEARSYFHLIYGNKYNITESPNRYDKWDCSGYTYNTGVPYLAELKKRHCDYWMYPTAYLEKKKYDFLINHFYKTNITPFYLCFYESRSFVFNLANIDFSKIRLADEDLPNFTADNCGTEKKKVNKPTYHLPFELGKMINSGYTQMDRLI